MFCLKCGTVVPEESTYCHNCGAELGPFAAPAAAKARPAVRPAKRHRAVLLGGAAALGIAALVLIGVFLLRPFGGGDGATDERSFVPDSTTPTATTAPSPATRNDEVEATAPGAWMFRGNPAHTGEYPGPGIQGSPVLLWRFKMGGVDEDSSPAVVDGVVYVESNDGYIYALDADTGELLWRFERVGPYASSPAVVDGVVFVDHSFDDVYALAADSGEVLWRFQKDGGGGTSPAVVDGVVYVGGGDYVYALDADTGELLWRSDTGDTAHNGSPAVMDAVVYVTTGSETAALDANTGEIL